MLAFSSCAVWAIPRGDSSDVKPRLWGAQASVVAVHGLSSCGFRAQATGLAVAVHKLLCSTVCGFFQGTPEMELMSFVLQGRFLPLDHQRIPSFRLLYKREGNGEVMASHSVFLPGESHGRRSLVGYSLRGCKEPDTTEFLTNTHHITIILPLVSIY